MRKSASKAQRVNQNWKVISRRSLMQKYNSDTSWPKSSANASITSQELRRMCSNLESRWNQYTRIAKATPVYIVYDFTEDENGHARKDHPPVSENFQYLEDRYI